MAHYPIKCVYCFKEIPNAEVMFYTGDKQLTGVPVRWPVMGIPNTGRAAVPLQQKEEPASVLLKDKVDLFDGDTDDAEDEHSDEERNQSLAKFLTIDQLKKEFPDGNVSPKNYSVTVTPEFFGEKAAGEDALYTEVEYTDEEGNRMALCHRYCPHCGGRLPSLSGTMPTYLVTVLGTSSSGKTVFLVALYQMLKNGQRKMRLNRGQLDGDAAENDMLIAELSKELYFKGILPVTTLDSFPAPVTFQLTFSLEMKAGNLVPQKECILALADMKGEDLTDAKAEALVMMHEKYRSSDAFLFMVDPENTPGYFDVAGENQSRPEAHGKLTNLVRDHIANQFGSNSVDKPTAIMLTKVDKFFTLAKKFPTLGLSRRISGTLNPDTTSEMYKSQSYFELIGKETKTLLEEFDNRLYAFLGRTFPNAIYTNIAALGPAPEIYNEKSELRIRNPNIETAIRLEDPLLLLLSQLHFVPPYETIPPVIQERPLPGRFDRERRKIEQWNKRARESNNRFQKIVNDWRESYTLSAPSSSLPS